MSNLPYISSPGNIDKALEAVKAASVPEKVSQDFVKTILKISGGSGDQMTSYLKKIGLSSVDGTPTDLYRKFRNPSSSRSAIAACMKEAYAALYRRNEYVHELPDNKLLGLIVEETGLAHDAQSVRLMQSCFKHLKSFATFGEQEKELVTMPSPSPNEYSKDEAYTRSENSAKSYGINLGYTINLNLPATSDPAVFDAIFKSLKEHLLRESDA